MGPRNDFEPICGAHLSQPISHKKQDPPVSAARVANGLSHRGWGGQRRYLAELSWEKQSIRN